MHSAAPVTELFFESNILSTRLVTKANLERTVPALKEVLISSEEGVARVRGAAGDSKGEVGLHRHLPQLVRSALPALVGNKRVHRGWGMW